MLTWSNSKPQIAEVVSPPALLHLHCQGQLSWFAQVKGREGYLAICTTPWNGGHRAQHPAGGGYTSVSVYFEPSLGRMDYRRIVKYVFLDDCDYNDICKAYRDYVDEQGRLRTLEEKALRNPVLRQWGKWREDLCPVA